MGFKVSNASANKLVRKQGLSRALDPHANGASLSKLTEVFILGGQRIEKEDGRKARGNEERGLRKGEERGLRKGEERGLRKGAERREKRDKGVEKMRNITTCLCLLFSFLKALRYS